MKLLLENFRKYLNEYSRPYSRPSKIKIVSDVLYYEPEGGRLFLVAEFERHVGGPLMRFGFYTSRGESMPGTDHLANTWTPTTGIQESDGWIMKISDKYPHPHSLLAMVGAQISKKIPSAEQDKMRRAAKVEFRDTTKGPRGNRFSHREEEQNIKGAHDKQISDINQLFKAHGVYDIDSEDMDGMQISESPSIKTIKEK